MQKIINFIIFTILMANSLKIFAEFSTITNGSNEMEDGNKALFADAGLKSKLLFERFMVNEKKCRLEHRWSCGPTPNTTELSTLEKLSCQVARAFCPKTKNAVNECCVVHDACYGEKKGQKNCDDHLCQCLSIATKNDGPLCEMNVGVGFCALNRIIGGGRYNSSK